MVPFYLKPALISILHSKLQENSKLKVKIKEYFFSDDIVPLHMYVNCFTFRELFSLFF